MMSKSTFLLNEYQYRDKIIFVLGLTLVMSGCASLKPEQNWVRNRGKDYHSSQLVAPLQVPEGFHTKPHSSTYSIPKNYDPNNTNYHVSIVPPNVPELTKSSVSKKG